MLLTLGGPAWLAASGIRLSIFWAYLLAAVPGLVLLAIWAWSGDAYRVHGGRAEMRLFDDRLEIPRARRSGVDVLPLVGLSIQLVTVEGSVNFIPVSETLFLHLQAQNCRRQLVHPVVGGREVLKRIAEDILLTQRGEPPTADPTPADHPAARDELDDQLDSELAKLD